MKLIAAVAAGALAIGTLATAPADAQHRGHHRGQVHRAYGAVGHHRGGYGWRGHPRGRVVCRHRGYHGRLRRCFRGYR